jgi:hypothetical protein
LFVVAAALVACGGSTEDSGVPGGASASGGSAGAGGSAGTGSSAGAGTGGSAASGGVHLAGVARLCANDADCTVLYGQTCCSQSAYGIAKTAVAAYGGCFWTDVSKCMTGCASPNWYRTDTGAMTPMIPYGTDARQYVAVHCAVGLCTTDALPRDAGAD